jgi:hypothetical protein
MPLIWRPQTTPLLHMSWYSMGGEGFAAATGTVDELAVYCVRMRSHRTSKIVRFDSDRPITAISPCMSAWQIGRDFQRCNRGAARVRNATGQGRRRALFGASCWPESGGPSVKPGPTTAESSPKIGRGVLDVIGSALQSDRRLGGPVTPPPRFPGCLTLRCSFHAENREGATSTASIANCSEEALRFEICPWQNP